MKATTTGMSAGLTASLLGGLVGGLVGGVAMFAALRLGGHDELPSPVHNAVTQNVEVDRAPPLPAGDVAVPDLSPVFARLDALAAEVDRLRDALASQSASDARVPVATSSTAIVDVESLQVAMDEIERRRIDAMGYDELRQRARIEAKSGGMREATEAYERLLERALTPEQRAETLNELAMVQRSQKSPEGLAAAERTLQVIVDEFGAQSAAGREASLQVIWTVGQAGDSQRAFDLARAYVADPGLSPQQRVNGRWAMAIQQRAVGDPVGARTGFEQLLREIDGQPGQAKLAADIRQRLENW